MSGNDALMVEWGDCDEQRSLGASVRRLLGTVVTTGASPSELSAAAAAIDRVTNKLAAAAPRRDMSGEPDAPAGGLTVAACLDRLDGRKLQAFLHIVSTPTLLGLHFRGVVL